MLEIFIPTYLKNKSLEINKISTNFKGAVKKLWWKIEEFESTFFRGTLVSTKKYSEDFIILCNWEFWEYYFLDYDISSPLQRGARGGDLFTSGTRIIWQNQISQRLNKIMLHVAEITEILSSNNLLTNTKKEEILAKIKHTFFSLAGVIFLLYGLQKKATQNLEELENYSWKAEYEWQAALLKETSLTKSIELQAAIDKLEGKIEMFIWVIGKLI